MRIATNKKQQPEKRKICPYFVAKYVKYEPVKYETTLYKFDMSFFTLVTHSANATPNDE